MLNGNRSRGWFGEATPRQKRLFSLGLAAKPPAPVKKEDSRGSDGPRNPRWGIPLNDYEKSTGLPKAKKRFLRKTWFKRILQFWCIERHGEAVPLDTP